MQTHYKKKNVNSKLKYLNYEDNMLLIIFSLSLSNV